MEEQEKSIQDYLIAVRKRKTAIIVIFIVIISLTTLVAFLLPSIYRSSSTILIEKQEIPRELAMSTVTSYASQRIQIIQARVMTRTNLLKIVDKFKLYEDERKVETEAEIVEHMRQDVSLEVISAQVVDPRTGRPSSATIAFSLAFKGESPPKVQRVANELTTLYLDANLTSRVEKASEASDFFEEESKRLSKLINEIEEKLAVFKQKYADALPELQQLNLGVLQRKETELTSLDEQLRRVGDRQFYLTEQLAQFGSGSSNDSELLERLKVLQVQYAAGKSRYSIDHPDMIRLKGEIESLEDVTGKTSNIGAITNELRLLNGKLAQKRQQYTADHPDIISLKEKIAAIKSEQQITKNKSIDEVSDIQPDDPLYLTTKSQLAVLESEEKFIKKQREEVLTRISEIEKSLYESPQVEREYMTLRRSYGNLVSRYQQNQAKQVRADVGKQLESESKGEKFTLIDPAALPEKPVSPNRPAIIFLGFILALGGSLGFAIAADGISGAVRGVRGIQRSLGTMPLSVIPYEINLQDRIKTKRIKKRIIILFVAVILSAILFIHFVVSPLDVLWFRILRKVDILLA